MFKTGIHTEMHLWGKLVYHQIDNIIFIAPTQKMFCSFKGPTDIAVSSVNTTLKQRRLAINIYYQLK